MYTYTYTYVCIYIMRKHTYTHPQTHTPHTHTRAHTHTAGDGLIGARASRARSTRSQAASVQTKRVKQACSYLNPKP